MRRARNKWQVVLMMLNLVRHFCQCYCLKEATHTWVRNRWDISPGNVLHPLDPCRVFTFHLFCAVCTSNSSLLPPVLPDGCHRSLPILWVNHAKLCSLRKHNSRVLSEIQHFL